MHMNMLNVLMISIPITTSKSYIEIRPPSQVGIVELLKPKRQDRTPSLVIPISLKMKKIFLKHSKFSLTKYLDPANLESYMEQLTETPAMLWLSR